MEHIDTDDLEAHVLEVARKLDPEVEAIWIDPDLADTAAFCQRYGYSLEESGNCILVRSKTGELRYTACLVQATRQLDLNRHARLLVGARKASFAGSDESIERTRMVPGGITPIGLPDDLPVFIDAPIVALDRVIVGGGSRRLKLRLRPKSFEALAHVTVVDISRDPPRS
jgi:prolyl-tRNA editing enzyme YbaK/EbsC (Cys-tRNA(Pro) deacylase)